MSTTYGFVVVAKVLRKLWFLKEVKLPYEIFSFTPPPAWGVILVLLIYLQNFISFHVCFKTHLDS